MKVNGITQVQQWFISDRWRMLLGFAVVNLVICALLLFLPDGVISLGLGIMFAALGAVFLLAAAATWWAEHRGITDGADLWDHEEDNENDRPEELLATFHAFAGDSTTDGSGESPSESEPGAEPSQ